MYVSTLRDILFFNIIHKFLKVILSYYIIHKELLGASRGPEHAAILFP